MSEYFIPNCRAFTEAANTAKARRNAREKIYINDQKAKGVRNPECSFVTWQQCAGCGNRAYSTTANGEFLSIHSERPKQCGFIEAQVKDTLKEQCILKRTLLQIAALDGKSHACPAEGCTIVVNQAGETKGEDNCGSIVMDQTDFTGCNMFDEGMCQKVIRQCYAQTQLIEQGLNRASFPDAESTNNLMLNMVRMAYVSGCTTFKSTKSDFLE